ncbi:MAG TPA: hypothetical protein VN414_00670 [Methanosarcina sp.]|nr:hypothetical protein [Methanosarcina sp.]
MLKLKGTESGYDEFVNITANGKTILDSQMASKAYHIICDMEFGELYILLLFFKKIL